ncbi:MAG: hypothetical protein MUW56_12290 [Chryseobacterium sp.]|uniref:hypothetical protein n=1 Tax=Chryseobacterium sp. TaxID=1871047 RepID=UPI0025C71916|nr:hypothetical protein [Chryseobacterium sp.]MCJ7934387.1 hypothetical protein [Chryseobacterium sp.]
MIPGASRPIEACWFLFIGATNGVCLKRNTAFSTYEPASLLYALYNENPFLKNSD